MPNALANSLSPYLRQHAENPVDWQPWGQAPFEEAARRGVPLFISIGYATCHWCHVMARESFSDPSIAKLLNENFVPVKVDREEHPEVDSTFLTQASAFTQNLGWPLNVFVTPAGAAFFAGTYWPPDAMRGHPSFRQILDRVIEAWRDHRDEIQHSAASLIAAIPQLTTPGTTELPDLGGWDAGLSQVVSQLEAQEDSQFGGFGAAPKFPLAPVLNFLLEFASESSTGLATRSLSAMAESGLRDQVEGGFFRYATRRDWTEPHYERMLYDNAQLLESYARVASQRGPDATLAMSTAQGIANFLLTILRVEGGFASAQNSESVVDGYLTEGDYYALSAEQRKKQPRPALDEKVLAGWNGMAIGALAEAGFRLEQPEWISAALKVANELLANHKSPDGRLIRATLASERSPAAATLEDYGLLAVGLLQLALASGDVAFALEAKSLVDLCTLENSFGIPGGGDPTLQSLGIQVADPTEGPYPSGESALAQACSVLFQLTSDRKYQDAARRSIGALWNFAVQHPLGFGGALTVAASLSRPDSQLVIVSGEPIDSAMAEFSRTFRPRASIVLTLSETQAREWADAGFELLSYRGTSNGKTTAYFCEDFVCRLPVTDLAALEALLAG
ncbi:MAG: thioredoxin domain-containing protein [Cryobacterium sp.]|nr:thioredoxin domain-containing protein [Cryobacterium sp.]